MYQPLGKFILAEPIKMQTEREDTTSSGIILQTKKEVRADLAVAKATVLEIGDEVKKIKKNDIVLYNYFSGNNILLLGRDPMGKDDKELHLIFEDDILAKETI